MAARKERPLLATIRVVALIALVGIIAFLAIKGL